MEMRQDYEMLICIDVPSECKKVFTKRKELELSLKLGILIIY
jgi:hypothetical protein